MGNPSDMDGKTANEVLPSLIAVAITFIALDTIFVTLRTVSRLAIQKVSFGMDDLLIFPAYLMNVGLCAIAIVMAKYEMLAGNPPADQVLLSPDIYYTVIQPATKCIYALLPMLYLGAVFPKLSLLFLYLRIFVNRSVRMWSIVTMVFVTAAGVAFTLTGLFACHPVNYFWNRMIPGRCIDIDKFYRINTPFHALLDIIILLIPMPALWKLQAPRSKKFGLTFVFALAGCGLIACMGRWVTVLKFTSEVLAANTTVLIVGWCIVEPAIYLIAACLPPCSSLIMLVANNGRVRRMVIGSGGTSQSTTKASRKSVLRLSSKPTSGFGRLSDEESQHNERTRASSFKNPNRVVQEKSGSPQNLPMRNLGIGVRTDVVIEASQPKRSGGGDGDASLMEMLRQGY